VDEPVPVAEVDPAEVQTLPALQAEIVVEKSGRDHLGPHELDTFRRETLLEEAGRGVVRMLERARRDRGGGVADSLLNQPPVRVHEDPEPSGVSHGVPECELEDELAPLRSARRRSYGSQADDALIDEESARRERRGGSHDDEERRRGEHDETAAATLLQMGTLEPPAAARPGHACATEFRILQLALSSGQKLSLQITHRIAHEVSPS
jgi:hypothetical protein